MNTMMPHTLTRLLACAVPPLWFTGLLTFLTAQRLPLGLFLLPCAACFVFSAIAAWRATATHAEASTIRMPTRIGLHIAGIWVLPYALIALLTLLGYPRLLPAYLAMLLPAFVYVIWPGDLRRFGEALGVGALLALIATWVTVAQFIPGPIVPRLVVSIETTIACLMAAMPSWTLIAYFRLVQDHRAASPVVVAVVVVVAVILLVAVYGLLAIGMSGMTD